MSLNNILSDPRFNFLSLFEEEIEEDPVPDSFFINNHFSPYANINISCNYIDILNLNELKQGKLNIMSLNIQSLPAKFNEFSELIQEFRLCNTCPDVVCLQETWNVIDTSMFPLVNFHPLETNLRQNARGGGVGLFINLELSYKVLKQFSIFSERIFECLFVEITTCDNKQIVVGTVYRPGTKIPGLTFTDQFNQFSEILSNLLAELNEKYEHVFIYGDFNLNILELSNNKFISEYIDGIFSHGYLQLVTRPTRIGENTATLIDHILTNSPLPSHETYVLCSQVSDHFPIIHQLDFKKPKIEKK